MKRTKVVHCQKEKFDIYIGRACYGFSESEWANPFKIGKDGTRRKVIEKYKIWLLNNKKLMDKIHELSGLTLGCWCFPKACHGDVIAELADR